MKFCPRQAAAAAVVFGCIATVSADFTAYQYKGLDAVTMHWDAIDNQRTGSHVSDATTWIDLVGGKTMTLDPACANFADDAKALTCVSRAKGAAGTGTGLSADQMHNYMGFEAVIDSTAKVNTMLWTAGDSYSYGRSLFFSKDGWCSYWTYNRSNASVDNLFDAGPRNIATMYGDAVAIEAAYANGVKGVNSNRSPNLYSQKSGGVFTLGGYNTGTASEATCPFIGRIFALRFYTRRLTEAEVLFNCHLDEARFNYGGTFHVLGFPEEYGEPSPAYGSSSPEGDTVTLSPGPLEEYDDGVFAVPVADGVRVKCVGWVRNGDFSVTNAIPGGPVVLAGLKSAAWIWQRQYRITAKATAGCPSVTLDGETDATVTKWVAEGGTVTLSTSPADSSLCVPGWKGMGEGCSVNALANTMTVTPTGPLTLSPVTAAKSSLRFWRGTSNANAATAANWVDQDGVSALPENGSTVILDADSANNNLTWNLSDVTLGAWFQSGYTGTVTFQNGTPHTANGSVRTVYGVLEGDETFRKIKVTGDVILATGVWTHSNQPTTWKSTDTGITTGEGAWRLIVHAGGDFEIGTGAKVDLDRAGFYNYTGPGTYTTISGGSHGGLGGGGNAACQDYARRPYGDVYHPVTIGSGSQGHYGAGAAEFRAGGEFVHNGVISAKANDIINGNNSYYAGAGGAVWITASSMKGAGLIDAGGGSAASGGAGSGGRISLCLTGLDSDFSEFTGTVKALPGGVNSLPSAGTVYRETASTVSNGVLEVTGNGLLTVRLGFTSLPDNGYDYHFSKVTIREGGRLGISAGTTVYVDELVTQSKTKSGLSLFGGTVVLPADYEAADLTLFNAAAGSKIAFGTANGAGTLVVHPSAQFICDAPMELGGLHLESGAVLKHTTNTGDDYLKASTSRYVRIDLEVKGDVVIDSGAEVNAVDGGYPQDRGPGYTLNLGGSYGGCGKGAPLSACYGSVKYPVSFGSGAGGKNKNGGGAIRIIASGDMTVNGTVSANSTDFAGGGQRTGSGGSVWLAARTLSGSGSITANAGTSTTDESRGGGGRVAVHLTGDGATFDGFTDAGGVISAYSGGKTAGAGTVYLSTVSGGVTNGVLVVDDGTAAGKTRPTGISPSVTDAEVDDVVVRNGGYLAVAQDSTLKVRGDFCAGSAFASEAGDAEHVAGTVEFVDAAAIGRVFGTNDFARLVIDEPGKTVKFGTEAELTLTRVGQLQVNGADGNTVKLRSTTDDVQWPLAMYGAAEVNFADVKDSNAATAGGLAISAKDSADGGNNVNWTFSSIVIGETITWNGSSDTGWANISNWDKKREPVDTDVVVIPENCDYYPVLSAAVTLNTLSVNEGASLNLAGYALTVTNGFTVAGSLVAAASEVITAGMGADLGGGFTAANSTFVLAGDGSVSFNPGGNAFHELSVTHVGALTFTGTFSAQVFRAGAASPLELTFPAGQTIAIGEAYVHGADASRVTLRSSSEGTRFNLNVATVESFYGVNVRDSKATGLTIYADAPASDYGNNDNWSFGGSANTWIGANNGKFSAAANWSGGVVPDAMTRVVFNSSGAILLDTNAVVREVKAENGCSITISPTTNELHTTGSFVMESGSTFSLNAPAVVSNSVILRAGSTLTHSGMTAANQAITNRISLTVHGDMTVFAGARVDASGKGFQWNASYGYGWGNPGASHGGVGAGGAQSFDSVFRPIHPGSNGAGWDAGGHGGGVVYLTVKGSLVNDGAITANGGNCTYYGASGGSIWINAGTISGSGAIRADSSMCSTGQSDKRGGGGRVAIYAGDGDFSGLTGLVTAYGTRGYNATTLEEGKPYGAAGTVYYADSRKPLEGTLVIDGGNSGLTGQYTPIPATGADADSAADFADVTLVVKNGGGVSFTEDVRFAEIEYPAAKVSVKLNDHEVYVASPAHRPVRSTGKNRGWVDRAVEDAGTNGLGHYRFKPIGSMLILR